MAETRDVFVIQKTGDKSFWHRAGVAFENKDGSLNLKLDLFPNVDLQIRERKEKEEGAQK
jgi:hypothetical protein